MAKGKSSATALKRIIHQISLEVSAWRQHRRYGRFSVGAAEELPPFYQMAALRGEGLLLSRFFGEVLRKTGMEVEPQVWLDFWRDAVLDGGFLTDFINRTGWLALLSDSADIPGLTPGMARQYYALLLDALAQSRPELLEEAVDAYFLHLWRQRFPAQAVPENQSEAEQLRNRLQMRLRRQSHLPVEVRESFDQQADKVVFRLLHRCGPHDGWRELIRLERPRLKTARLAAYEQALREIGRTEDVPESMEIVSGRRYRVEDGQILQ
jgi:hypothetical protein